MHLKLTGKCPFPFKQKLSFIFVVMAVTQQFAIAEESTAQAKVSLFQQLYRSGTRVLSDVLGFASIVLKNFSPPTTPELIKRHGYPVETHYVKTEDNVILEMHRMPHGQTFEFFRLKPRVPVLLVHGIAQSSSDFLLNSPSKNSLGFFLSDEGYDVWLGNLRGLPNQNTRNGNFTWNYSFHEMGIYDVPAMVQYICERTGFSNIHYVGFSMGNTALMTALAKLPHLNFRLKVGVALGPSVFQDNYYNGWLKLVAKFAGPGEALQNAFGSIPLLHPWAAQILHRILPIICHPRIDLIGVCLTVSQLIFGYDKGQITKEKLAAVTQVSPTPFSSKLIIHYMQHLRSGRFCEYDYGREKNLQLYGSSQPPNYNLSNVVTPISIVVGQEDRLAHRLDAVTLATALPNVVDFHTVPYQHFHHLDFCYAEDAGFLVNYHVLKILRNYG